MANKIDIYQGKGRIFTVQYNGIGLTDFDNILVQFISGGKAFAKYCLGDNEGFVTGNITVNSDTEFVIELRPNDTKTAQIGDYSIDIKLKHDDTPDEIVIQAGKILLHRLAKN